MFLIGVAPASAQIDVLGLLGVGVFLVVLLAIAIALHVVTAPQSDHHATHSGSPDQRLGPAV
jgi:hypothetical protein